MPVNLYYTQRVRGFQQESVKYSKESVHRRFVTEIGRKAPKQKDELKKTGIASCCFIGSKRQGVSNAGQSLSDKILLQNINDVSKKSF